MTLPTKIGVGALTVGTISGVSYAGSTYFMNSEEKQEAKEKKDEQQGTTIEALINKEYKHILLSTAAGESNTDQEHWRTIWTSYQEESQKHDSDIFGLVGWNKERPTDLTDKLKEKCGKLIIENVLDNSNTTYQNVTKYCARNVTIKDHATKEQLTIINTKGEDNVWGEIAGRVTSLAEHFNNLKITASSGSAITANEIKGGCEKAISKNRSEDDYETVYKSYKEVCTKKK